MVRQDEGISAHRRCCRFGNGGWCGDGYTDRASQHRRLRQQHDHYNLVGVPMGLLTWVGKPFGLLSGPWRAFFGMSTTSGETVTYEHAMQLDAVWACVNLISNAVKTLPCNVYKGDGVDVDYENPLYELLHDLPNLDD